MHSQVHTIIYICIYIYITIIYIYVDITLQLLPHAYFPLQVWFMYRIIVSCTRVFCDGVSSGLHCFLRLFSAGHGLIVVLVPGCWWAYSAFSV